MKSDGTLLFSTFLGDLTTTQRQIPLIADACSYTAVRTECNANFFRDLDADLGDPGKNFIYLPYREEFEDWLCRHCGHLNRATPAFARRCTVQN